MVTLSGPIAEEILAERGGAAAENKSPALHRSTPSSRPDRSRSRVSLTPRADGTFDDPDVDALRVARGGTLQPNPTSLGSRPVVLRPVDSAYPPVVVTSEGTFIRVSQPTGRGREPSTIPVARRCCTCA